MNSIAAPANIDEIGVLQGDLLCLKPDGEAGFEGLVAHAIASFMGRHFRVARAGRQHGRDGATNPGSFDVFFEAKLYSGKPPSTEDLQSKFLSAIQDYHPQLDVWIVACSVPLGENSARDVVITGERFGVTVVILDWSRHSLPPLAVLLAKVPDAVSEWLAGHTTPTLHAAIDAGLTSLRTHPAYPAALAEIDRLLSPATAGWDAARVRNSAWLAATLANQQRARQAFGQFIAPDDPHLSAVIRQHAADQIVAAMSAECAPIVALVGDEGTGKTWLSAMAWESVEDRPVFLLFTTDNPAWDVALRDPLRFIARLLMEQSGGSPLNDAEDRWLRRLENWAKGPAAGPRLWLVLDGLNERESRAWTALVDKLMELPAGLGLRLLLTSRPAFFHERVLPRLRGYAIEQITVEPFTAQQVLEALSSRGVDGAAVPDAVREFLCNPRIFSIAVGMLDRVKPDELTRERLLFEYWSKRYQERNNLRHNDGDMRRLLISHANAIREVLKNFGQAAAASFRRDLWKQHSGLAQRVTDPTIDDELTEVESGRFFQPDPDTEGNYRIRPEGLAYALGLLIIDEIRGAAEIEMPEKIDAAIDPIRGLDLVADVLLAALGIACIDPKCPDVVAAALIYSLLDVQNLPDASAEIILAYVTTRPAAFIAAAELQWASPRQHRDRSKWLAWFLSQKCGHGAVQPLLDAAIRRWLTGWCSEPDRFPRNGLSGDEVEKEKARHEERRVKIAERKRSLTAVERAFLEKHCHEVFEPSLMSIDGLALELIAGRSLAPFAEAIVGWQLCDTLSPRNFSSTGAEAELSWILRLNPVDLKATGHALHAALAQMQSEAPSETGVWTAIGTLRCTGLPSDDILAEELLKKLPPREWRPGWRRIENFCDTDPLDPNGPHPTNLANAITRINAIEASKLRSATSFTIEDGDVRDLTPALARFALEPLIEKLRAFARDLVNRSGHAARFLGFQLPKISALLSPADVGQVRDAYYSFAASIDASADTENYVGAQYVLLALLPHLEASEQLDALLALPEGKAEMLQFREFFKPLDPKALALRLEEAERDNAVKALRRTLFFAATGQTPLTEQSRATLRRCFVHSNHVIRLLAFEATARYRDDVLLSEIAKSNWSGLKTDAESVESFYGSKALSRVPKRFHGVDTLMRMSLDWQSAVINEWGEECARRHAEIITHLIRASLDLPDDLAPEVPIQRSLETPSEPVMYPMMDTGPEERKTEDGLAALKRMAEDTGEFWKAEQDRKRQAAEAYISKLEERDAARLVDPVYVEGFAAIASGAPDAFETIVTLLFRATDRQMRSLASMAACAAIVLSRVGQLDRAADLFERFGQVKPEVNLIIGPAELPFCRLALWLADDSPRIAQLRKSRLRSLPNDAELFTEVLCAINAGKTAEVVEYAEALMATEHTGDMARALILVGFCDANAVSPILLNDSRCALGFLAEVVATARAAYERNIWARHWYEAACTTQESVAFWRNCALMIRAADGRFISWYKPVDDLQQPALMSFARFASDGLKDRAKTKRNDRGKTLFGLHPPSEVTSVAMREATARMVE